MDSTPRSEAPILASGRRAPRAQQGAVDSTPRSEAPILASGRRSPRAQQGAVDSTPRSEAFILAGGRRSPRAQQGAVDSTPRSEAPIGLWAGPPRSEHGLRSPRALSHPPARKVNKIPYVLSREAEELRRLLRQDVEECLRGIVGEGMQDLRRDLREWLSDQRMPKDEMASQAAVRFDPQPQEPLVSRDEIDQLNCRMQTGASYGHLEDAKDDAHVPMPDEVTSALEDETAKRSLSATVHEQSIAKVVKEKLSNSIAMPSPSSREDESQHSLPVWWEWERSNNMGWKSYTGRQSETIEKGWQSGVSRVRVRSGCDGRTPMEIYFVDMVQLDPESERVRRIRRMGRVPWYTRPLRVWRALAYSFETGEPLWETLEQYRLRQSSLSTAERAFVLKTRTRSRDSRLEKSPAKRSARQLVKSRSLISFFSLSSAITLFWCVWFGVDVQSYPGGESVYEKEMPFVVGELFFSGFFLLELVVRIGACVTVWECISDVWIRIDALCVFGSLVDIIFVPVALAVVPSLGDHFADTEWSVFRSLRLFKLLRITRLSRVSLDMNIFCKGIWSGLRESSIAWAILIFLVFVFSVLLTTYTTTDMRETTFSSLGATMNILIHSGVLLDGVADVFSDMVASSDVVGYLLLLVFVIISQYIILSMLMGIMICVAIDVRGEEQMRHKLAYLRHDLKNILECYIHDDETISRKEFGLIIQNADVNSVLRNLGASVDHLKSMEQSLYAKSDHVDFDTMFETISHLDAGKNSTVRDIFYVHDALQRTLISIESQLASAGFHGRR